MAGSSVVFCDPFFSLDVLFQKLGTIKELEEGERKLLVTSKDVDGIAYQVFGIREAGFQMPRQAPQGEQWEFPVVSRLLHETADEVVISLLYWYHVLSGGFFFGVEEKLQLKDSMEQLRVALKGAEIGMQALTKTYSSERFKFKRTQKRDSQLYADSFRHLEKYAWVLQYSLANENEITKEVECSELYFSPVGLPPEPAEEVELDEIDLSREEEPGNGEIVRTWMREVKQTLDKHTSLRSVEKEWLVNEWVGVRQKLFTKELLKSLGFIDYPPCYTYTNSATTKVDFSPGSQYPILFVEMRWHCDPFPKALNLVFQSPNFLVTTRIDVGSKTITASHHREGDFSAVGGYSSFTDTTLKWVE